jgi:DNA-binding winged helix-turn-helix (wHTH) protein/tetratricopeptide (TPR) repeat protein
MGPSRAPLSAYLFGDFRLSVRDRILERNGERVLLTPKVIDTLFVLVENQRQVVTKEALMKAVWPDVTVIESGLTRNMSALRKALEDGVPEGSYIETIPRRGYRFLAEVQEERMESAPATAAEEPLHTGGTPPARRVPPSRELMVTSVIAAAVIGVVWLAYSPRAAVQPPVDPRVRIAEHLLYKLAPEETLRASEHFQQAVAESPNMAAAHAGLAVALLQLSTLGVHSLAEVADRADTAAKRALTLDPDLPTAHYASASLEMAHHWRFDKAETGFRRALELDPTSVQSRFGYAHLKFAKGEVPAALRLIEEALRLDPASPLLGARYCQAFYYARDFHRAEAECRKVLDREPGYALAYYYLALSLGSLGRTDEARRSLDRTSFMAGVLEADRAWLSLRDGDRRPAVQVLERRRQLIAQGKINGSAKLLLCAILGRNDEALEAIEAGMATRAVEMLTLNVEPRLDPLRSDPRFRDVLRRIGLMPPG